MATSQFATIMERVGVPALLAQFGVPTIHSNSAGEVNVTAMVDTTLTAVGEFGERMEHRTTITVAKSVNPAVGDTFTYEGTITDEDPYPDDVTWLVVQILSDDGYTVTCAVRQQL